MVYNTNFIFYTIIIIIILIIFMVIYYKYYYVSFNTDYITLIDEPTQFKGNYENHINLTDLITDRQTLLKDGVGYGITILLDMYISNNSGNMAWITPFTRMKPIINLDDNLIISYNPSKGHIYIILKFINAVGEIVMTELDMGMIPLQKWAKHAFILDNNKIIYIRDGIIIKSKTINYTPIIKGMNIILGNKNNNFFGKVRKLQLIPRPINISEII